MEEEIIADSESEKKKKYKKANCNFCGGNYYKDHLQRHIDVGLKRSLMYF